MLLVWHSWIIVSSFIIHYIRNIYKTFSLCKLYLLECEYFQRCVFFSGNGGWSPYKDGCKTSTFFLIGGDRIYRKGAITLMCCNWWNEDTVWTILGFGNIYKICVKSTEKGEYFQEKCNIKLIMISTNKNQSCVYFVTLKSNGV